MSEANESHTVTETEQPQIAVNRVLNLAIFFVGIGVFAAAGFGLERIALFAPFQITYFAVGGVIGAVGLLLWLVTR